MKQPNIPVIVHGKRGVLTYRRHVVNGDFFHVEFEDGTVDKFVMEGEIEYV
ncbi:hypothetical protein NVP1101O_179 [Vibrio phage 1.101.O._10N.261.45.C6]|nr:hypothetical protein NVP1101O_179 [Vibrio phage 1.101.O._10N.261.45.C6]